MCAVLQKRGEILVGALGEVFADDNHRDAGGAKIFLGAGEDDAVPLHVDGARSDVRRHVGDQRHLASFRQGCPLRAFDGVVGADVDVGGIWREFHFVAAGKPRELFRFGGGRDMVEDTLLQFTNGLGGPSAGMENVNGLSREAEVHRGHGELHAAAPLHKNDRVIV